MDEYTTSERKIGCCSICGGEVWGFYGFWHGVTPPPPPTCRTCGAVEAASVGPVIPMVPRRPCVLGSVTTTAPIDGAIVMWSGGENVYATP